MKRLVALILASVIFCVTFTGCYDRREVDDLAYVMALGLDKGKTAPLKLTLQFAVPKAAGGGSSGSSGGGEGGGKPVQTITLEASSIYAGLDMANSFIGKEVNISHAKALIISEELARDGVNTYIYASARGREFRPDLFVAVSRGSAEDFINSIQPVQEIDPSKYYDLLFTTSKYTGFTSDMLFHKFYTDMESLVIQPVAALAGLGRFKSSKEFVVAPDIAKAENKPFPYEGDFKAGEIPRSGEPKAEIMGLAVFDGPKMVGEINGDESTAYLMVSGDFTTGDHSIPDPKFPGEFIGLKIGQSRKPENKVEFIDGKPSIQVKISLEADIDSIQSGFNYESLDNMPTLEEAAVRFFKNDIKKFLDRTAKEFHSDICGFGLEAKKKFLTYKEWENFKWLGRYKDSSFTVDVDVKIRRPGLLIRSPQFISSKSKEGQ